MLKRRMKKERRRLKGTFFVTVLVGLLFWWWRRRAGKEAAPGGAGAATPESISVEPVLKSDDLTRIRGIGPKVSALLRDEGITSFTQLAALEVPELQRMLREAGLTMMDPATWLPQAQLAAEGKWEELEDLLSQ